MDASTPALRFKDQLDKLGALTTVPPAAVALLIAPPLTRAALFRSLLRSAWARVTSGRKSEFVPGVLARGRETGHGILRIIDWYLAHEARPAVEHCAALRSECPCLIEPNAGFGVFRRHVMDRRTAFVVVVAHHARSRAPEPDGDAVEFADGVRSWSDIRAALEASRRGTGLHLGLVVCRSVGLARSAVQIGDGIGVVISYQHPAGIASGVALARAWVSALGPNGRTVPEAFNIAFEKALAGTRPEGAPPWQSSASLPQA